MSRAFARTVSALLLAAGAAGCAGDVPSPALVEDLRVLAIRAEPPELLVERPADGVAPAPLTVSFQALVMDPRGGPMVYDWRFCPVESDETCADYDQRRGKAAAQFHPALDAARALTLSGQAPLVGPMGDAAVESFSVAVAPELFGYHLAASGLGLGNGAWVSAVLNLAEGNEKLLAQKRVVLNARDLADWNPELASFGWQVCPAPPAVGLPGCLALAPRVANRNPEIAGVELARGEKASTPFAPVSGPLTVAPGEKIRLRPVLGPGADEPYQTVESALTDDRLVVVDRREEPVASWFATAGEFEDEQTVPQLTKTLDNVFTAPLTPPPSGRISVFIVIRDQRGGVTWTPVELQMM